MALLPTNPAPNTAKIAAIAFELVIEPPNCVLITVNAAIVEMIMVYANFLCDQGTVADSQPSSAATTPIPSPKPIWMITCVASSDELAELGAANARLTVEVTVKTITANRSASNLLFCISLPENFKYIGVMLSVNEQNQFE